MEDKRIISSLVGLVGAVNNNGKTEQTDNIILDALTLVKETENSLYDESILNMVEKIKEEKFKISPDCATCKSPCGNTSDYNINDFYNENEEIRKLKEELYERLIELAGKYRIEQVTFDITILYKGIAYFGYSLQKESYEKILREIEEIQKKLKIR